PLRLAIAHHTWRWLSPMLVAGVVAWVVSMPLIAFHFDQLNLWAVIASLLLAPVVFLALIGGFFKIAMTAMLPFAAPLWATIAGAPIAWMRHAVDLLAMLPGSDVPLPAKSISLIVIYYALLCIPLLPIVLPRLTQA